LGGPTIRTLAHLWGLGEEELSALLCVGEKKKKKKEVKKRTRQRHHTHTVAKSGGNILVKRPESV
jgi:hypothetical protein